jgi:hypothetical protein
LQPGEIGIEPSIIEAKPIDHGAVFGKAENPRPRIAGLRARRDRAGFHKAETQTQQRQYGLSVLIKAGSEAERIAEAKPCNFRRQAWVIRTAILAGQAKRKGTKRDTMGGFGIHAAHERHDGGDYGGCHGALLPWKVVWGKGCQDRRWGLMRHGQAGSD